MNKFIESFKSKKFRYGSYSAVSVIIVIAVLIVINLVVGMTDIKKDLTDQQVYSISDTSKEIISGINDNITIYALFKTGNEDKSVSEILDQYAQFSNISVEYKDPYLYPQFASQFKNDSNSEISTNSLIVVCGDKSKVIDADELRTYDYNYQTGQSSAVSLDVEPKVTSAIQFVTMEKLPVIYCVSGHSEEALPSTLQAQLETANYEIKDIETAKNAIPDDCTILFLTTPKRDYSPDEAQAIKDYLADDGRAVVLSSFTGNDFPNYEGIINAYGVQTGKKFVVETDPSYCLQNSPTYLIPKLDSSSDVTSAMRSDGYLVLMPLAQPIETMELKKSSVEISPLLTTSEKSYAKLNSESTTINKEEGDTDGPFSVAAAIEDRTYTDKQHSTKLVVCGSSYFIDDSIDTYTGGSNSTFIMNAVKWLDDSTSSAYIKSKSLQAESVVVDSANAMRITVVSCVIIPLAILIAGFIIWLKRRNK